MKRVLILFVLAATMVFGAISTVAASGAMELPVMPCSSEDNYDSTTTAFCEDFTVSTAMAYELIVNGIDNKAANDIKTSYNGSVIRPLIKDAFNYHNEFVLLDVRALAEWVWIGHPGDASDYVKNGATFEATGTTGAELIGKVYNVSIGYCTPPTFSMDVEGFIAGVELRFGTPEDAQDITFITMCRSGDRSRMSAAILQSLGYNVLSMDDGFEGDRDDLGRRNLNEGWKNEGFPYRDAEADKGYIDPYLMMMGQ